MSSDTRGHSVGKGTFGMLASVQNIEIAQMQEQKRSAVKQLALTGGPGGGKTKLLAFIAKKAKRAGIHLEVVPEAATMLMNTGISPHGGEEKLLNFQRAVLREHGFQESREVVLRTQSSVPMVIRCWDRGRPDTRAYINEHQYRALLREQDVRHPLYARDYYDAVIHMRTAALGAEKHYSNRSNKRRSEDCDLAREIDQRTLESWLGHEHLAVIGNSYGSFRGKLEAGWRAAKRLLGIPEPLEIEKKYLIRPVDFAQLGISHVVIDIEQHYLRIPGSEGKTCRVRSWGEEGHATYTFTEKLHVAPGITKEIEEHISEEAFAHYTKYRDPATIPLRKRRTCFVHDDQYFMYDEFHTGVRGLTMLEIEVERPDSPVFLPPFVSLVEDVSRDRAYTSAAIARVRA